MKYEKTLQEAKKDFEEKIIPNLEAFVRIDNLSPNYDPNWETNGKAEKAGMHLLNWAKSQEIKGYYMDILINNLPLEYGRKAYTQINLSEKMVYYMVVDQVMMVMLFLP